jgi:hypothetical protein
MFLRNGTVQKLTGKGKNAFKMIADVKCFKKSQVQKQKALGVEFFH